MVDVVLEELVELELLDEVELLVELDELDDVDELVLEDVEELLLELLAVELLEELDEVEELELLEELDVLDEVDELVLELVPVGLVGLLLSQPAANNPTASTATAQATGLRIGFRFIDVLPCGWNRGPATEPESLLAVDRAGADREQRDGPGGRRSSFGRLPAGGPSGGPTPVERTEEPIVTYEYGVVIRRQRKGEPAFWQFWIGAGCIKEGSSFLAIMDWAGARGFEAFAAGNFDELGVPEVLLRRAVASPPPPPLPRARGRAGAELDAAPGKTGAAPAKPRARKKASKSAKSPKNRS